MSKFTVQVLTDKEFDKLPYHGISDSLGIADRDKGLAFVRETGIKDFDRATLIHEIDHLVEKHGTHVDEYNISHKKWANTIADLVATAAAAWHPLAGAIVGGAVEGWKESKGEGMSGNKAWGIAPAIVGGALGGGQILGGVAKGALAKGAITAAATGVQTHDAGQALSSGVSSGLTQYGVGGLTSGAISGATEAGENPATAGLLGRTAGAVKGAAGSVLGTTPQATGATYPAGTPVGTTNMGTFSQFPGGTAAGLASAPVSTAPQTLGIGQSILGNAIGSGIGSSLVNSADQNTAPLQGPATQAQAAQGASNLSQVPGMSSAAPAPLVQSAVPAVQAPIEAATPSSSILSSLGKKAGEFVTQPTNLLGAGSLLSSALVKQPEYEQPQSVEDIRSKLLSGTGLTSLGQQARGELGTILKSTPQELYPTANDAYYQAALRRTRDSYAIAKKNLDAQYNLAGVYGSGEHLAAQDKLQQQLTNAETDLYAQTEQRNFELARTAKYQAIQDSLGVDKNVMDDLVGLTGLDVQTAAMVYGARVADVQSIREALGTIGSELLVRGSGMNMQPANGININLGGVGR